MSHECNNPAKVTCGNCGRSWCERCDPAPSVLCHWCNGRGYSTAPMGATDRVRCTWYEFRRDNLEGVDLDEVEAALLKDGSYTGGGGAQPIWTVSVG